LLRQRTPGFRAKQRRVGSGSEDPVERPRLEAGLFQSRLDLLNFLFGESLGRALLKQRR
jgi:hypothetical protein